MKGFSIRYAAKMTGVSVHALRIWQHRYGWPQPTVMPNGYRCYSEEQIKLIRRFARLLKAGHRHQDLIVDGMVRWPDTHRHTSFDQLASLPYPSDRRTAVEALDGIRDAITTRNGARLMEQLLVVACIVHPLDRVGAGWLPALAGLVAWEAIGRPMPGAGEAWRFIRDRVGAAALAQLMQQARTNQRKDEG